MGIGDVEVEVVRAANEAVGQGHRMPARETEGILQRGNCRDGLPVELHHAEVIRGPLADDRRAIDAREVEAQAVVIHAGVAVGAGTAADPLRVRTVGDPLGRDVADDLRGAGAIAGAGDERVIRVGLADGEGVGAVHAGVPDARLRKAVGLAFAEAAGLVEGHNLSLREGAVKQFHLVDAAGEERRHGGRTRADAERKRGRGRDGTRVRSGIALRHAGHAVEIEGDAGGAAAIYRHGDQMPLAVGGHDESRGIIDERTVANLEAESVAAAKEQAVADDAVVGNLAMLHDDADGVAERRGLHPRIHGEIAGAEADGRVGGHFHVVIHAVEAQAVRDVTEQGRDGAVEMRAVVAAGEVVRGDARGFIEWQPEHHARRRRQAVRVATAHWRGDGEFHGAGRGAAVTVGNRDRDRISAGAVLGAGRRRLNAGERARAVLLRQRDGPGAERGHIAKAGVRLQFRKRGERGAVERKPAGPAHGHSLTALAGVAAAIRRGPGARDDERAEAVRHGADDGDGDIGSSCGADGAVVCGGWRVEVPLRTARHGLVRRAGDGGRNEILNGDCLRADGLVAAKIRDLPDACDHHGTNTTGRCADDGEDQACDRSAIVRVGRGREVPCRAAVHGLVRAAVDGWRRGIHHGHGLGAVRRVAAEVGDFPYAGDDLGTHAVGGGADDGQSQAGGRSAIVRVGRGREIPRRAAVHGLVRAAVDGWRSRVNDRDGLAARRDVTAIIHAPPGAGNDLGADAVGDGADDGDDDVGRGAGSRATGVGRRRRIKDPWRSAIDSLVRGADQRERPGAGRGHDEL